MVASSFLFQAVSNTREFGDLWSLKAPSYKEGGVEEEPLSPPLVTQGVLPQLLLPPTDEIFFYWNALHFFQLNPTVNRSFLSQWQIQPRGFGGLAILVFPFPQTLLPPLEEKDEVSSLACSP